METFVVIPCLNEQENLAATCASLGFGANVTRTSSKLVLVDNGSTDGTRAVMEQVRSDSAKGSVLLVTEPCRGYVPARRAGIAHVLACAQGERVPLNEILVLQADADTIYLEGYVDAMRDAFAGQTGRMLEGCAVTNREFKAQYPEFTGLCRMVDSAMEPLLANDEDQIVVDDKVSGFALSDYLLWGEHHDEVDAGGRQVLAETTRLFVRARRSDQALHISVPEASALPSRRKVIAQAPAYFASSGFPRDQAWRASWSDSVGAAAFLESPRQSAMIQKLIRSRQRHQLALFGVLPCAMRDSVHAEGTLSELTHRLRRLISRQTPGVIIGEILSLADQEDGPLDAAIEIWGARC